MDSEGHGRLASVESPEPMGRLSSQTSDALVGGAGTPNARLSSQTPDQQMSFRNRWSSSTSSRIASGSWLRCHWHSSRRAGLAFALRRGSTCGLDRIGGPHQGSCRGDVCDGPGLASSVRGMPCCPAQVLWPRAPLHGRPAARAWVILTSPRTQARACSIRLTRPWVLRAEPTRRRSRTCSAQDAAQRARRW